MKLPLCIFACLLSVAIPARSQQLFMQSPNGKVAVSLVNETGGDTGEWYLKLDYSDSGKKSEVIPRINLGLSRSDQDFAKELKWIKNSKPVQVIEKYSLPHGKKSVCTNAGNEVVVFFENAGKKKMNLVIRAYNDGLVFRYEFPGEPGKYTILDELTSYQVPAATTRWLEKWNTANEGLYVSQSDDKIVQQDWCYPALFNTPDKACWFLVHEADLGRTYCGSKLSNLTDKSIYKITFPNPKDGNGKGESQPTIATPWKSPWRVIIIGHLSDIVESTLVNDVSAPAPDTNFDWVRPGLVSWNYWSNNHGTKDYKVVCDFADLAARMNWPYTLLDWEWDAMGNGGQLEDAARYIISKGVRPFIWYNSGGPHTGVPATPRDRMFTHENRVAEFTRLQAMGFVGVKVDFFESEKQDMINYYLDILEDAARFKMMVYFHGCMVPRGWERTYPHLMTSEAVRGAEWYNNGPDFTATAPEHNTILPFTRNVVGAMDYTPVTFTNSQFPHLTSFGHELALGILFESGLQHLADRPEGYDQLPDAARSLLKELPNAWDDIHFIDGYPGKEVILARRKGNQWWIAGNNAELREKKRTVHFDFLPEGQQYKLTLVSDGEHDHSLSTRYLLVDKTSSVEIKMLRRGGFAGKLQPIGPENLNKQ